MTVLASASPRRQQLLSLICCDFTIEPADIDETAGKEIPLEKKPEFLAVKKAKHIQSNGHQNDIVIGCDTGVFFGGKMLGKPKSEQDAFDMLKMLSGNRHKVITGCSVLYKEKMISFSQTTEVEFYELTEKEIKDYIATKEPMDKAGAYGIQGFGTVLVKKIDGDFYNVVGLPVAELKRKLDEISK